tara:strand:+ start:574 stop:1302 length:729 start_codon:yes stop_codon:yes gene_type:complete
MIENQAGQRSYIRRAVGHADDTALISTDLLDDCLGQALREINQTFPLEMVSSFATVAKQQTYSPLPADGYALKVVFYPQGMTEVAMPEGFLNYYNLLQTSEMVDELGNRRIYEPSIVTGFYQQLEFYNRLYANGAYKRNQKTVYLDPVPGKDGDTVYYTYYATRYATTEDIEDIHVEPYYAFALAQLHQALAVGRGALTSVNSAGGVSMNTRAAEQHYKMSERMMKRYDSFKPVLLPGRSWR